MIAALHRVLKLILPDDRWNSWLLWRAEREERWAREDRKREDGWKRRAGIMPNVSPPKVQARPPHPSHRCDSCREYVLKNGCGDTLRVVHECAEGRGVVTPICTS